MNPPDGAVASHYELDDLLDTILQAVGAARDGGRIDQQKLSAVEEFHLAGADATERLIPQLGLAPGNRLLDIGSGVGGPARHVARETGAEVTGVDLTPGYRHIAEELSARTGLKDRTRFVTGSALDLPCEDGEFDAAMMLHVGMNIADKVRMMAEAARVLRPGGRFVVYDVMRVGAGEPDYPLPWAPTPDLSFLEPPETYRGAAEAAGLRVVDQTARGAETKAFLQRTRERMETAKAQGLPPPPGINLVMGADAPTKLANLGSAVMRDMLAPVELVLEKPA